MCVDMWLSPNNRYVATIAQINARSPAYNTSLTGLSLLLWNVSFVPINESYDFA